MRSATSLLLRGAALAAALLPACASASKDEPALEAGRVFDFEYEVVVPETVDLAAGPLRVWVPVPVNDGRQTVEVQAMPAAAQTGGPDRHGNVFATVLVAPDSAQRSFLWKYRVWRSVDRGGEDVDTRLITEEQRKELYLGPDRMVPVGGPAEGAAREAAAGKEEPFAVARAFYDRVLADMEYKKEGTGWGKGSTQWACEAGYGNCTDFHAKFISMARFRGLPARFQIGYPLPAQRGSGELGGYHCWAHFYVDGYGWIPVDISEADKNPEKAEFFFSHLDADRVTLSYGRDLVLDPPQQGEPLNFLVYAYGEQNGKPVTLQTKARYRDLE
ncbi:MAG: transglutaminase domain-containing protein [Planctomycetota bacterium]|nr:MAG: transglutaminase domain-containing protein [Planctomycetota bacterium]